jgi:hypothetical protein
MVGRQLHNKRARFDQEFISRDAIHGGHMRSVPKTFNPSRKEIYFPRIKTIATSEGRRLPKYNADGKIYIGGKQFAWVLVAQGGHAKGSIAVNEWQLPSIVLDLHEPIYRQYKYTWLLPMLLHQLRSLSPTITKDQCMER